MNRRIIGALIAKDFKLYFRNRFFAVITVLALVAYIGIYFAMPRSINENLVIGLHAPPALHSVFELAGEEGLTFEAVESDAAAREAVDEGQYQAAIVLPSDIMEKLAAGQQARIDVYFPSDAPDEFKDWITIFLEELAYSLSGQELTIDVSYEILGTDMAGMQIPPRDRMLPLFAVLIIMMEMMGVASLLSEEIHGGTARALLVTPMTVQGLFVAKGIMGVSLAFGQAVLLLVAVGGLNQQPLPILVALLLGAILVTGIAFLVAALAKEMMSVLGLCMLVMLILMVPTFGVMFPGMVSGWARIIPSYYLVDAVHLSANFGIGWGGVWDNLLILLGFDTAFISLGILVLRRKLR